MPIDAAQLETWSHSGSVIQSKETCATIKKALEADDTPYVGKSVESFLQGSYGNDTNVWADSDVDIVMKLNSTFYKDLSRLPDDQKAAQERAHSNAAYKLADFKSDVISVLRKRFGSDVDPGKKAVWIRPNGVRRNADVLIAAQFRRYYEFHDLSNQRYDEGIFFQLPDGTRIENFPKLHSKNCTAKHQSTRQWFKPMVRIVKNMRNHMVDEGMIVDGLAPSYFLEGLLYNVPDENFGVSYSNTFTNCVNWLATADPDKLVCANRMHWLVRDGSPIMWSLASFPQFLTAAVHLWNNW